VLSLARVLEKMTEGPKSVRGNQSEEVDLSGALLPWRNGAPVYIPSKSHHGQYYLPCFTDIDALRLFMLRAQVFDYEVKRIGVGSEFLKSFKDSNIKVVLDPSQLPDGKVEIEELRLPASDKWKLSQC
jgi:hypothetical protein